MAVNKSITGSARISRDRSVCRRGRTPDSASRTRTCPSTHTTMFARGLARRLPHRPIRRWAHTPSGLQFNSITEEDIGHFAKILPSTSILSTLPPVSTPASELSNFNNDWMNKYHGKSSTVLKPHSAQEVSEIVKWCNERRIGVVPQGGNTGLVGGGVPTSNELIINLGNMTKIRSFDPVTGE